MEEMIGIVGPCALFVFGFGVMGYLSRRDRLERMQDHQTLQRKRLEADRTESSARVLVSRHSQLQAQAKPQSQAQSALPRR